MKTRVTLTLDPSVHLMAKRTARSRQTTVSALVEGLIRQADRKKHADALVAGMVGCASVRDSQEGADPLLDALKARHLGKKS